MILSIKFGGHDTAAALMIDGVPVAACEQERYTFDKHSRLFPIDAIDDCLAIANITIDQVDEIAFVNDLLYYIREIYLRPALENDDRIGFLIKDIDRIKNAYTMEDLIREKTGFKGPISFHRHHLCHLASAYYPSGFEDALLVSFDGMAESETGMLATGINGEIEIIAADVHYPHSLGLIYSAITFFLGWMHHCDEGIIMGLAPFGDANAIIPGSEKTYADIFSEIIIETGPYTYEIDQSWMSYFEVRDKWVSDKFTKIFGPKRDYNDPLTDHHKNIAAALQKRLEDVALRQLRHARKETGLNRLCLAGGVALNCSMNGKILQSGIFDEIFVQPASGDQGTTIGACFLAHQKRGNSVKPRKWHNFYLGSRFSDDQIQAAFKDANVEFLKPADLYNLTAQKLEDGKIIAWFQGGAEFGPRALGNRSILCRPYPEEMRDHLNARVKFREEFRPFAPAVLAEHAEEYFTIGQETPHMLMATQATEANREKISATVHIDGSCRAQTVTESNNERFYKLLTAFNDRTGVPVLLNTSFNVKGQPIVNSPSIAIECFNSTNIDCLIIGDYFVEKTSANVQ